MKIFITAALVLVGVFGLGNNKPEFAIFGLVGTFVMYGGTVIYDSYAKSQNRFKGMSVILFFLLFGAAAHAQVAPEPLSAPKFERRYSYYESRDRHDPVTYSFTADCLLVSNGELLKIVIGNEADLLPIVGWGTDANGDPYLDSEEYRIIVRPNEIIRIWAYSVRSYDVFKVQKI